MELFTLNEKKVVPQPSRERTIPYFRVIFKGELRKQDLSAFRGAIVRKVGTAYRLFHNHQEDGYRYAYPLIQYQVIDGHPALLCLGEGVDEMQQLFMQHKWEIQIHDRPVNMQIRDLHLEDKSFSIHPDKTFYYQIQDWLALKPVRFQEYLRLKSQADRQAYLERILCGNMLSMAKGIGWNVAERIQIQIEDFSDESRSRMANKKMIGFQARFQTNLDLPDGIGLGKRPSLGFGVITKLNH